MESMGKKPRRRRSFTPEFKAEIVELCQRGDRSAGQVARDFDLTGTAVREWVKQSERDTGTRTDGGLTSTERQELSGSRSPVQGYTVTRAVRRQSIRVTDPFVVVESAWHQREAVVLLQITVLG
jgi:transposase